MLSLLDLSKPIRTRSPLQPPKGVNLAMATAYVRLCTAQGQLIVPEDGLDRYGSIPRSPGTPSRGQANASALRHRQFYQALQQELIHFEGFPAAG
jgi:hypothetical protein